MSSPVYYMSQSEVEVGYRGRSGKKRSGHGHGQGHGAVWVRPGEGGRGYKPRRTHSLDRHERRSGSRDRHQYRSGSLKRVEVKEYFKKVKGYEGNIYRSDSHERLASKTKYVEKEPEPAKKKGHDPYFIVIVVFTLLVFIVNAFFVAAGSTVLGFFLNLFKNTTQGIGSLYESEIRPTAATFSIWSVIYPWQGVYFIYMMTTPCRKGRLGYFYMYPVIPRAVYWVTWANAACVVAWLLLWDREILEASTVALWAVTITSDVTVALTARNLYNLRGDLGKDKKGRIEYWLVQALYLNGVGLYNGWTFCAMLLNTQIALSYGTLTQLPVATSSMIAFVMLLVLFIVYACLDMTIWEKYTRYLVTPYISILAAAAGSVARNSQTASATNRGLGGTTLALVIVALIAKIVLLAVRERRNPLLKSS